jgi:hypothetical protein
MISSTSSFSTDTNVRTVFDFIAKPPGLAPPCRPPGTGGRLQSFADDPDYPSAAMIEYLTRQIIAAIIFGDPDSSFGKPLS